MKKTTADVVKLIESGLAPQDALRQCGFGEVSEATMTRLNEVYANASAKLIQGLYEAANDRRNNPAARAKAFQEWERQTSKRSAVGQKITIIIEGEKEDV